MKSKVVCIGAYPALQRTLAIPVFRPGAVNRMRDVAASVAGKAVNTARVVQRLGYPCALTGFTGGDTGARLLRLLREEGLPASDWVQTDLPVRICQTVVPTDGGPFTELVEEGPDLAPADWQNLVAQGRNLMAADTNGVCVCSGTMPPYAPQTFYAHLMAGQGERVILDTSGPSLLEALPQHPLLVKINAAELCRSAGAAPSRDPAILRAAAHQLLAVGAQAVGVTLGSAPAWLFTPSATWHYSVPTVPVASALGSGDSVNAGIAVALHNGSPLEQAFAFGLACGTANAETMQPGVLAADRAEQLAQQILPSPA